MDLPTHFFFGLAIGFVFFGHQPELALLVGMGALLPDLDREYWFIPAKTYAAEQRHRALFHNVVVIAISFVVSPFLSLGVFLHVLQDSFTTVKDRGVEWFYPFTRLAKRGRYDANGNEQTVDPEEKVYFYQEDPPGLVKFADADLQETLDKPIPWRRVYGFALNSHLLETRARNQRRQNHPKRSTPTHQPANEAGPQVLSQQARRGFAFQPSQELPKRRNHESGAWTWGFFRVWTRSG